MLVSSSTNMVQSLPIVEYIPGQWPEPELDNRFLQAVNGPCSEPVLDNRWTMFKLGPELESRRIKDNHVNMDNFGTWTWQQIMTKRWSCLVIWTMLWLGWGLELTDDLMWLNGKFWEVDKDQSLTTDQN